MSSFLRVDTELSVDAREVCFDGLDGDVERRRNLLVGVTFGDELGHTPFGWGEHVACWCPPGDSFQLGARLLRPEGSAELLEDSQRGLERHPRRTPSPESSL